MPYQEKTVPQPSIEDLKKTAKQIRRDIIEMTFASASGHPGGSLSAVEIVTALYFSVMRHDPQNPAWPDRDRFILSKGHASPLLYSALARGGYFDPALLPTFRKFGSPLQGHPDRRRLPGVEASTGPSARGFPSGSATRLRAALIKKIILLMLS